MKLDHSKPEVKIALEMRIYEEEGIFDEQQIDILISDIPEPLRSLVIKEMECMSLLTLDELCVELTRCMTD